MDPGPGAVCLCLIYMYYRVQFKLRNEICIWKSQDWHYTQVCYSVTHMADVPLLVAGGTT